MQLVQPPTDVLPASPDLRGSDSSLALCTDVCPDLCAVALCPGALCGSGSAVCPDGFDGDAAILCPTMLALRRREPDVLPSPSFVLPRPYVLLRSGFGLLC